MPLLQIGKADAVPIKIKQVTSTGGTTVSSYGGSDVGVGINLATMRRLIGDFSRGYFFQIDIPSVDDSSQTLSMLAKTTTLPAHTLEDKSFEFQGSKYKMAGHSTFDDWTVTFVCDEYHKLRHKFIAWQSFIFDPIRQIPFTANSYKKSDVKVIQLSREGKVVSAYTFYGIYPNRIGEVNLSQSSGDVEEFSVTFSYDYFVIDTYVNNADYTRAGSEVTKEEYSIYDENIDGKQSAIDTRKISLPESLQVDKADNADQDYNGRGNTQPAPVGFLASQLKKLSPFPLGGDINTTDPFTFLDAANWMNFRYSPPLRFRVRKFLGDNVNKTIDGATIPNINPYDALSLEKKV